MLSSILIGPLRAYSGPWLTKRCSQVYLQDTHAALPCHFYPFIGVWNRSAAPALVEAQGTL